MEGYIAAVAERYGAAIGEYDVINEMIMNLRHTQRLQGYRFPNLADPNVGLQIFNLADQYLPDAKLVVLECPGPKDTFLYRAVLEYHKRLLELGAPVDVVGTQCHFYTEDPVYLPYPRNDAIAPEDVQRFVPFQIGHPSGGIGAFTMKAIEKGLDLVGALGKTVHITEHNPPSRNGDISGPQPRLTDQEVAAWTENFYTLAFSKPYLCQLTRWFVVDSVQGRGVDAGLVTQEGEKKASYYALRKLLKETWSSRWQGRAGPAGASFRGFYGTYEARVRGYRAARFDLLAGGASSVTVALERENG
jgi:hypothetical protein